MVKNIEKINPIKRELVSEILRQIGEYPYINKIIIFGSSVRNDCKDSSDLDIAIEWTEDPIDEDGVFKPFTLPVYTVISHVTEGNNDVIPIGYEGPLLEEAIKEGVIVYHK